MVYRWRLKQAHSYSGWRLKEEEEGDEDDDGYDDDGLEGDDG